MRNIVKAFRRIPEKTRTIGYGLFSLLKNLFYFCFKVIVGIVFKSPLLIAIAIYNILIGLVKANCSRGLWKNRDDLKDIKTYLLGGVILSLSSMFYIAYTVIQLYYPSNTKYNLIIAIAIACFACYSMTLSILGLVWAKGKTMLIKEYKFTNFATALTNIVLTQIAILSFTTVQDMSVYNSLMGGLVGVVILGFGLYFIINGSIKYRRHVRKINNIESNSALSK